MNRDPSTLSRELKRNAPPVHTGYYLPHKAHERAVKRNKESHRRKRLKSPQTRSYVRRRIKADWSPELTAGRWNTLHPESSISHEAIYQWIYADERELITYLVRAHKKRERRGYSRKHKKSHIPNRILLTENTDHEKTNRILGTKSYFCEPYHSWEKGTVENTIGLVRRFLPKKTDFAIVSSKDIRTIERWLNNRPRKCLNFNTPAEAMKVERVALAG